MNDCFKKFFRFVLIFPFLSIFLYVVKPIKVANAAPGCWLVTTHTYPPGHSTCQSYCPQGYCAWGQYGDGVFWRYQIECFGDGGCKGQLWNCSSSADADCGGGDGNGDGATHKECGGDYGTACVTVSGAGSNQCSTNADCCAKFSWSNGGTCTVNPPGGQCPSDYQWCYAGCCRYTGGDDGEPPPPPPPPEKHLECRSGSCVEISGAGANQCSTNADCRHRECQNGSCVEVAGAGNNQCSTDANCRHNACQNQACVAVLTPGSDECSNDTQCDTIAPVCQSISINDGAVYATNKLVTLSLSATDAQGVSEMSFSNNNAAFSPWETYAATKSNWDLTASAYGGTSSEGQKNVYARFKDAAGNISSSCSDSIIYDASVTLYGFGWEVGKKNPNVWVAAADSGSGLAVSSYAAWYKDQHHSNWEPLANVTFSGTPASGTITALSVPFARESVTENKVKFQIQDLAGNVGSLEGTVNNTVSGAWIQTLWGDVHVNASVRLGKAPPE